MKKLLSAFVVLFALSGYAFCSDLVGVMGTQWTFSTPYELRSDTITTAGYTYYGQAEVGTKKSQTGWIVWRLNNTTYDIEYASGTKVPNKTFNSAGTYTYTEGM